MNRGLLLKANGQSWPTSCRRRNRRVEMMPSLTDSQTRSSSWPEGRWPPIGFEFRIADGRVHRAMLASGARVPPPCLEAVHSRLRAAQVVPWRHAYSNRLLAGDGAHEPPAGSPHFLSSLIERSLS